MPGPRINRELGEMVDNLERQLTLLEEYSQHAFGEGRKEFLPEVAGKLRVLLVRSRNNVPLLFEVARRTAFVPRIVLNGPPVQPPPGEPGPGDEIDLDDFFDRQAVMIRTSSGLVSMTKRELIRAWCEQLGGAHEDWAVDEALVNAVRFPVLVGGMQAMVLELRNCARMTLVHGRRVVEHARGSNAP